MIEKTTFICPRCQNFAVRSPHTGDFNHDCFGIDALANEDVLVIGQWEDYTGSDNALQNLGLKAQENTLTGRPQIEGERVPPNFSSRGFPTNRFRQRRHIENIDAKEFKHEQTSESNPKEFI